MTRTLRSRRLALVAAATVSLALVAGACGSEPRSASDGVTASTDATASGGTAGGATTTSGPPVIVVAGTPTGGLSATSAGSEAGADAAGALDGKMLAALVTYVYSGEVPDLTGPAPSWYFPTGVAPSADDIRVVAESLGLSGDLADVPSEEGGGWRIGPADYSGPVLTVGTDALQSWWYSGVSAVDVEPCAYYPPGDPQADPATADLPLCEEPTPPANVPDDDTALDLAKDLFAQWGMDVSQYEFEAYGDEWAAGVTAYLVVDGMRTWVTAGVGFGGDGAVTYANGYFGSPVRGADYDRIGVQAVLDRLNAQMASWYTDVFVTDTGDGPTPKVVTEPAVEPAAATEAAADGAAPAAPLDSTGTDVVVDPQSTDVLVDPVPVESMPVESMPVEPMPVDPEPMPVDPEPMPVDPEAMEVTITGAVASLETVWAMDGTVWLLPGYLFSTGDGGTVTAPAVADAYLQYQEVEPLPVDEPMPVDVPVETEVVVPDDSGTSSGSGEAGPLCAGLPTSITEPGLGMSIADILVGMCVDDARAFVEGYQEGASMRIVREDGVDLAVTADYSESRVNVAVEGGVVTEVVSIG